MSPEAITARLREACKPVADRRSRVPMDPASVTARLRSVSQLRDLCSRLGRGQLTSSAEGSGKG